MQLVFESTDLFFSSHKMGEVKATEARITEVLGKPIEDNRDDDYEGEYGPWDDKVAVEWRGHIKLADGSKVAVAIWDYKGTLVYCDYASVWCEREEIMEHLIAFIEGREVPLIAS